MKTKTKEAIETTTESTVNPDLVAIEKAGQATNARKAVQSYQRAKARYGQLAAKCGQSRQVNASLSRKNGTLKELHQLDCSTLSTDEQRELAASIRAIKAWQVLTGEF